MNLLQKPSVMSSEMNSSSSFERLLSGQPWFAGTTFFRILAFIRHYWPYIIESCLCWGLLTVGYPGCWNWSNRVFRFVVEAATEVFCFSLLSRWFSRRAPIIISLFMRSVSWRLLGSVTRCLASHFALASCDYPPTVNNPSIRTGLGFLNRQFLAQADLLSSGCSISNRNANISSIRIVEPLFRVSSSFFLRILAICFSIILSTAYILSFK